MNFQSSRRFKTNRSKRHYSYESQTMQLGPSLSSNCCAGSLAWLWSRGRAGARRRRCVGDGGGAGKDQGTRVRPWVAAARPEMARGGPATRAAAAADGDGPVRWRGNDLQRGARRLQRRQLGYSFLGRKPHKRERESREGTEPRQSRTARRSWRRQPAPSAPRQTWRWRRVSGSS